MLERLRSAVKLLCLKCHPEHRDGNPTTGSELIRVGETKSPQRSPSITGQALVAVLERGEKNRGHSSEASCVKDTC
jgi:hypothetical protein